MDLYSDLDGDPTNGKQLETDLYEDVSLGLTLPPPHHKYQLYIGNLTWWTSDQDIADAVATLGIRDLLDVKFFEHRPNGQSKGFCMVSFGSEESIACCLEGLPKVVLHGNNPVVTYPSTKALMQFEATCKPRPMSNPSPQPQVNSAVLAPIGAGSMIHRHVPPPTHHRPPPQWHHPTNRPPPPLPHRPSMHPTRPDWNRPPPNIAHHNFSPQQPVPLNRPPPPFPPPKPAALNNLRPNVSTPFFPHGVSQNLAEQLHRVPPPNYVASKTGTNGVPAPAPPASPHGALKTAPVKASNYEEVVERNRSVANCAITRAVSSAAAGEYAVAIETLVTALSVIKYSETAKDERCKTLISSLQETLHKVESKSYGATKRERSRSKDKERFSRRYRRDRSRSRDRDRDRSRDRERDRYYYDNYYRDRSRSREDRYYEDRYRDRRESDRDRERRESDRETSRRESEREQVSRRESDREQPSRRESDREQPSRRESEREQLSRRESEREQLSRRESEREQHSRRESDRETSRRDDRDQPSRRESERDRDREREKDGSRREVDPERETSTRESEKESRRDTDKEGARRETSRREFDRDETRRDPEWERESRRDQHRRDSDRDKYYKLVEKEQSRESKQV